VLALPRVTVCCVDCVNHDLALAALHQCMQHASFARALFLTDRDCPLEGADCVRIPALRSRDDYSRFVIKDLAAYVDTDFVLLVQWDGFVVNPAAWSGDFLEHDYIGARWPFRDDGLTVGNGGFSLRSRRLLAALRDPAIVPGPLEDVTICRTYRAYLEAAHGIRFAPEAVADRFSFEATYFDALPFGFHGLFNFWMFLDARGLAHVLRFATPAILGSEQCLQLARNYLELGRRDEARTLLARIVAAHPGATAAAALLANVEADVTAAALPQATRECVASEPPEAPRPAPAAASPGRNDPCPCGSGKRYKACHGRISA